MVTIRGDGITFSVIAAEIMRDYGRGQPSPNVRAFRFDR